MEILIKVLSSLGVSLIGLALFLWMFRRFFKEFDKEYKIVKREIEE